MPDTTAAMIDHLASNISFVCPIWKIVSRGGLVAAYAAHTRTTIGFAINGPNGAATATPFVFGGATYQVAAVQTTRDMHNLGLSPNSTQIYGAFDDIITREDVENGRWDLAKIVYEYVDYLDLTIGSTGKMVGLAGRWEPKEHLYELEFFSNAQLLTQLIGDMTSPTDRNNFPAGENRVDWRVTRAVVSSSDRRHLVINGTAKPDHYFRYGVVVWATGANVKSPGMEIKDNVGNTIELQLEMPANIAPGDSVTLLAGYDGTREQARDVYDDAIDLNSEPDLPGLRELLSYPG